MIDRTFFEVIREFEFGAWDVGAMRFKVRQLTQMANYEIMIEMQHYKHELQQIEVSKSDKAVPERSQSATKWHVTSVALEALDGWLIVAVHNFPSTCQRGADDRTMQPLRICPS